ncbi:MAG: hypothetical protein J1E42_05725 [Akkermansiaceae bacterium]|nr:hypothetical protein [Akkermansiaceae bacterium]
MMKKKRITLEFTEEELHELAEMMGLVLIQLGETWQYLDKKRAKTWEQVAGKVLRIASHEVPDLVGQMEPSPQHKYWSFRPEYVEDAFFSTVHDELREASFWSELVAKMAEQALEAAIPTAVDMPDEERQRRTASLQEALQREVQTYGIQRLCFMIPERPDSLFPLS